MTGTGVQLVQHTVALSWTASTSTVVGYNVYRSTTSGGPYTLLTNAPVAGTAYTDSTVQSGVTYFYVVTAVNSNGTESVYSNESTAVVPIP
jgi:fibronectin type 3 domain-containing protein